MALPKNPDPVLAKMAEAYRLMKQAHNELGDRLADTNRSVARMYLKQSMQTLKRAAEFEGRAF